MNAAARLIKQQSFSHGWAFSLLLSRTQMTLLVMLIAILTSSLSIVYLTNLSRSSYAMLQQAQQEKDAIHMQWNQLLLEKSTWTVPARVQQIAEEQYDMVIPNDKSIVVVESQNNNQ